jgi:hypothetical protein
VVREIQTAAPLKGVTLEIDKNQGKKNWERGKNDSIKKRIIKQIW